MAFDLVLLDDLLAIYADFIVVAARRGGEDEVLACLRRFERCGVTDAARRFVSRAPPLLLVVVDSMCVGGLRSAGELLAGVGGFFRARFSVGLREHVVHFGQTAREKNMYIGSNEIGNAGDHAYRLESLGLR